MFVKALFGLAVAVSVGEAVASDPHHHHAAHHRLHKKQDGSSLTTQWTTTTKWVTATVLLDEGTSSTILPTPVVFYEGGSSRSHHPHSHSHKKSGTRSSALSSATLSSISQPSAAPTPSSSSEPAVVPTPIVVPTTFVTTPSAAPIPTTSSVAPLIQISVAPAVVPTPPAAPVASTGSKKRGLAYNQASLLSGFMGTGSKVSWRYNWDQKDDTSLAGTEFVPMLWSSNSDHQPTWLANAAKAIAAGSGHLLSFNEPDNGAQASMTPGQAAADHKALLVEPFGSKARIGAPAVTNSGASGEGLDWLKQFISACGANCVDFCPIHWYSPPDAASFLQHLKDAYAVCGKPIWITEFAPSGSDDQIASFLKTVMDAMDNNAEYSFVERYSYFMVGAGSLISSGTSLSSYGSIFAYS